MKVKALTYLEKRKILNSNEIDRNTLVAYGNFYLEKGAVNDALDFFEKAHFEEGIRKIRLLGLDEGDVLIFKKTSKMLKIENSKDDWNRVGEKAMELGKFRYAAIAFEEAGNEEKTQELRGYIGKE